MVFCWLKQNFIIKKFYSKGDIIGEAPVWLGVKDKVQLEVTQDVLGLVLRSDQKNNIDIQKDIPSSISAPLNAIAFNSVNTVLADVILSRKPYDLSVIGSLKANNWQNRQTVQLQIRDLIII